MLAFFQKSQIRFLTPQSSTSSYLYQLFHVSLYKGKIPRAQKKGKLQFNKMLAFIRKENQNSHFSCLETALLTNLKQLMFSILFPPTKIRHHILQSLQMTIQMEFLIFKYLFEDAEQIQPGQSKGVNDLNSLTLLQQQYHMEGQMTNKNERKKIRKVGPYLLLRPIGKGAFSIVYEGKIEGTNRKIAVKLYSLSNVKKKDYERIQMQIKILSLIRHPNIVELIDFKKSARHLYLVFEHCQNTDLEQHIKKYYNGVMPQSIVKRVFVQIKKAFEVLRNHRIVHRDLKLANILVAEDFTIKIADFGFAGLLQDNMFFRSCVGTPLTMAPEVLDRKVYDQKCDIWSLGIILYQMLQGTTPFVSSENMTLQALRQRILNKKIDFNPEIPLSKEVADLIGKMIVNEPRQRMSFQEFFNHPWLREDIPSSSNCLREVVLENSIKKYLQDFVPNQTSTAELVQYIDRIFLVKVFSHYKSILDNKLFNSITLSKKLIGCLQNESSQKAKNVIFVALLILFSKIQSVQEEDVTLIVNDIKIKMGSYSELGQIELPNETEFSKSLPFLLKKGQAQLKEQLTSLEQDQTYAEIIQTETPLLQQFFSLFFEYLNGRYDSELAGILLKVKIYQPTVNIVVTSEYLSKEAVELIVSPANLEGLKKVKKFSKDEEFTKLYKSKNNLFKTETKIVHNEPDKHSLEQLYETLKELL